MTWLFYKLSQVFGTLFLVLCVLFFIFQIVGGDPTLSLVGKNTDTATIDTLRSQLGLDQSLAVQFGVFFKQSLFWDWGTSWVSHRPVVQLIAEGFGPSFVILLSSLMTSLLTGYLLALVSLHHRGKWLDIFMQSGMSVLMSFHFVALVLLMQNLFAYQFNFFPVYGWENGWAGVQYAILPFFVHTLGSLAPKFIILRALLTSELDQHYVRTALAKGCSWRRIYGFHITANILPGLVVLVAAQLPTVLAGSVVLEVFWGIPGLGLLLLKSIQASDYPVIKAMTLLGSGFYIFTVMLGDVFTHYCLHKEANQ